jgi:hypothetical protein
LNRIKNDPPLVFNLAQTYSAGQRLFSNDCSIVFKTFTIIACFNKMATLGCVVKQVYSQHIACKRYAVLT